MRKILVVGLLWAVGAGSAWAGKKFTWNGGYPTAEAACRALIGTDGSHEFNRAIFNGNDAHCYVKPRKGKGDERYCCMVTKDPTPQPLKEEAKAESKPAVGPDGKSCDDLEKLKDAALQKEVTKRLKKVMDRTNEDFANDPTLARTVVSNAEFTGITDRFGGGGGPSMPPGAFYMLYGHILERLTAARMEQYDACLPTYLDYVPNIVQLQSDGAPDFLGKGKASGLELDITTIPMEAKKLAAGKKYTFVTYSRKLKLNAQGVAVKD